PRRQAPPGAARPAALARLLFSAGGPLPLPAGRLPAGRDAHRLRQPPRRRHQGEQPRGRPLTGDGVAAGHRRVLRPRPLVVTLNRSRLAATRSLRSGARGHNALRSEDSASRLTEKWSETLREGSVE